MTPFNRRKAQKKRRRVESEMEDQRTTALRVAGRELLAASDFENISIARLTRLAGCSVGAFYYRYPDKNSYLNQLIATTFHRLENSFEKRVSISAGEKVSSRISLSDFLSHITVKLSSNENAGVIRAALKLGATYPDSLRPYEKYRQRVTMEGESIFNAGTNKKNSAAKIRRAIQIAFAAINDAIIMSNSANMKLGGKELTDTICAMAAHHIGIKPGFTGSLVVIAGNKESSPVDNKQNAKISGKAINGKSNAKGKRHTVKLL